MARLLRVATAALRWFFGLLFLLMAIALLGMGGWLQAVCVAGIAVLLLPPARALERRITRKGLPWWGRASVALVLSILVILTIVLFPAASIYKSPTYRARFLRLYDRKLAAWPVPYESVFVNTSYGRVHVIASGPRSAPPLLLFNASGLAAWSWSSNVASLGSSFRTFAVDNIGEVGRNEMVARDRIPRTDSEVAAYCAEVADALGVEKAHVAGASIGGFVATVFALHAPARVDRLVLLGPMGYGNTSTTVLAMTVAQGFPFRAVQNATFRWAFGDSPRVQETFREWFYLVMEGSLPNPIAPHTFTPQELERVAAPTLAFFGSKDAVIGDPAKAAALAIHVPRVRVEIVDSGHLIGVERADVVNPAIVSFLSEDQPGPGSSSR